MSEYIKTDAHKLDVKDVKQSMAVTNAVSWRAEGIKYKKNEVFLDVTESMNLVVNSSGQVVHSEVTGALKMRSYLSGMPECKLGLNDKLMLEAQGRSGKGKSVELEDMKFHQCVRLTRFDTDRTISFIPPDGAFDLMTYRVNTPVKPLVWVEAVMEKGRSRVEYMVKIKGQFKERSTATGVEVKIPVSADATNPVVRCAVGAATYAPEQEALLWKIKQLPGGKARSVAEARCCLPLCDSLASPGQHPPGEGSSAAHPARPCPGCSTPSFRSTSYERSSRCPPSRRRTTRGASARRSR